MTFSASILRVSLHSSVPTFSRKDRRQTAKVLADTGAVTGAARVYKRLFPDSPTLAAINAHVTAVGDYHKRHTAEWASPVRVLPTKSFMDYSHQMNQFVSDFNAKAALFLADYEQEVLRAKDRLGDLFDINIYPPVDVMASKFQLYWKLCEDRSGADWRLELSEEATERAVSKAVESRQRELNAVIKSHYERINAALTVEGNKAKGVPDKRLDDYLEGFGKGNRLGEKRFQTILESCQFIRAMNLGGDPEIAALATGLESAVQMFNTETIKHDPSARAEMVTKVRTTLDSVDFNSKMGILL